MSKIDINEVRGQLALLGVEVLTPVGYDEEGLWFLALKPKGSHVYYLVELHEVLDGLVTRALIIWSHEGETYQVTTSWFGKTLADSLKQVAEAINDRYSSWAEAVQ